MRSLISKTIGTCLQERALKTPQLLGMSFRDFSYTWKEVDEISDFLAVCYLKLGIRHGNFAAIWSVNSPNAVLSFFALNKIGAVTVMINTCYKEKEMEDLLRDNDIEYLFYGIGCNNVKYQDILDRVSSEQVPKLKARLQLVEDGKEVWHQRNQFPEVMPQEDRKLLKEAKSKTDFMDTACILFTSGTTSRPKGTLLSHYNLVNNSAEIVRQMHWTEQDKLCVSVPIFHCFGITAGLLACIHSGASAHLLKYYKTLEVLEQVQKYRCTIINGVPTMFLAILHNKHRKDYDISSLRSGIIAGSPILSEEYELVCRELNFSHLQVSYGQTESSPCVTISDYEDSLQQKAQTSGKIIEHVEVAILSLDMGEIVKPGISGEILTRGYHVMQGYYKQPEETKAAVDDEGWLHTGDIGFLDKEGYLHVTGRKKDMIIRGGENISPLEIENCIFSIPGILDVKVVGIPAKVLQEEIAACIIVKEDMMLTDEEIQAYMRKRISDYKVPKYILRFQSFPMNASGKIQRGELRRRAVEMIMFNNKEEQACILQNSMS